MSPSFLKQRAWRRFLQRMQEELGYVESVRFMLDGERMFSNLTPRDYELKENDLIQAIHEAVGC